MCDGLDQRQFQLMSHIADSLTYLRKVFVKPYHIWMRKSHQKQSTSLRSQHHRKRIQHGGSWKSRWPEFLNVQARAHEIITESDELIYCGIWAWKGACGLVVFGHCHFQGEKSWLLIWVYGCLIRCVTARSNNESIGQMSLHGKWLEPDMTFSYLLRSCNWQIGRVRRRHETMPQPAPWRECRPVALFRKME